MACIARILGCDVEIVGDPGLLLEDGALGEWRSSINQIAVSDSIDAPNSGEALIHEVIEAIHSKLELDLKHRQIQALGAALYQFIRENPELVHAVIVGDKIPPQPKQRRKRSGTGRRETK